MSKKRSEVEQLERLAKMFSLISKEPGLTDSEKAKCMALAVSVNLRAKAISKAWKDTVLR